MKQLRMASVLAVGIALLFTVGCVRDSNDSDAGSQPAKWAAPSYPGGDSPEVLPRGRFNDSNFKENATAQARRHRTELVFPAALSNGAKFEGVYDPGDMNGLSQFAAVYSDTDVTVIVTVLPTVDDADRWLDDHIKAPFDVYVTEHQVGGTTMYALPRLNVAPVIDYEAERVQPGTGLVTGASNVMWTRGRFFVSVVSLNKPMTELIEVAKDVHVRPQPAH